jgi:hypothetical protein
MKKTKDTLRKVLVPFIVLLVITMGFLGGWTYLWRHLATNLLHYSINLSFPVGVVPYWTIPWMP